MNSAPPGWHPDPTNRHELRYWDGTRWTDDVADEGFTSIDPLGRGSGRFPSGDGTAAFGQNGVGPGGPGRVYETGHGNRYPYDRYSDEFGDAYFPEEPVKKRRSRALLAAVALIVIVAMAGGAYAVIQTRDGGDPQEAASQRPATTTTVPTTTPSGPGSDTTAPGGVPGTTAPGGGGPGGAPTAPGPGPGTTAPANPGATAPGGGAPGGGNPGGGGEDSAAVVDELAQQFETSTGGQLNADQSRCLAQAMVDGLGIERAEQLYQQGGGDPMAQLSPEDQQALYQHMVGCMGG